MLGFFFSFCAPYLVTDVSDECGGDAAVKVHRGERAEATTTVAATTTSAI